MSHAPTVFISAATIDLRPWRELLAKAFRAAQFTVLVQHEEDQTLGAPLRDVRDMLVKAIEASDCVIHLAGTGYGADATEPFAEDPAFRCSWTQFEYYHAYHTGRDVIALVCAPELSRLEKEETGDEKERALKSALQLAHRGRVSSGKFDGTPCKGPGRALNGKEARSVEDLLTRVAEAVGTLQREHGAFQAAKEELLGLADQIRRIGEGVDSANEKLDLILSLLAKGSFPPPPAFSALHTIPPPLENFVGREDELAALRELPAGSAAAITGLKGMGGIGKTQLAYVLADRWAPRFPDARILLDGRGTQDQWPTAGDLLAEVINAFHPEAKLPEDPNALKGIYHQVLAGKKALILLDNAKDTAQAAPLVPPAGCALIVTSRQRIILQGHAPVILGRMKDEDAAKLLRDAYGKLTDGEVARLIELCAGLPLALRLAASHLAFEAAERKGVANVSRYLAALGGGRLKHLDAEADDAGEVTISETLRLSVEPLPEEEKRAWQRLAIFTASFRADAAEAIAGAGQGMLDSFLRRSLLEAEEADRYRLHDLAADYALPHLAKEEAGTLVLAHAAHFTAVAAKANDIYLKGDQVAGLALFDRERTQIEAAWQALAKREDEPADRRMNSLVNALAYVGALRFHARQRIGWLEAQLRAARRIGDRQAEGSALGNLGTVHADVGDARTAIEYFEQSLTISREIGRRQAEGNALGNLGTTYAELGDARTAIGYHEQSLVISREIGDRRGEGCDLGNLGTTHAELGDARTAIEYYEQWLEITREIGDRRGEGDALGGLGIAHAGLGDARTAIGYYEQQVEITLELRDRRGEGNALWNSAVAVYEMGDPAKAIDLAEEALVIYKAIENPNATMVRRCLEEWRNPPAGNA